MQLELITLPAIEPPPMVLLDRFENAAGTVQLFAGTCTEGRPCYLVQGEDWMGRKPREWCRGRQYARDHFNFMRRQLKSGQHVQTW